MCGWRLRLRVNTLLSCGCASLFPLESSWRNSHYNDQTRDNECEGHKRHQDNAASRCREFTSDDIVLTLKIPMKAEEQDEDGWWAY